MCGIAGIVPKTKHPSTSTQLESMLACLCKRGPDESGSFAFSGASIGMNRLAIIDVAGGHQPMKDAHYGMVFNGEIYNYRELKKTLQSLGHNFNTQSDTEVVLKAYQEYGADCVRHLDGMFAFAIWNEKEQTLFLARDRFGEKPLYVATLQGTLYFASEIKAIHAAQTEARAIDPVSLDNYFALMYVPPWRSMYQDIHPIHPAHHALYKNGILTQKQYWKLEKRACTDSFEEASHTIREMLTNSVRSRLVADVEVGSFLSGGIDSGLITRLAAKEAPGRLKSFSAGFEDFINELPYAKEIADLSHTDHHAQNIQVDILDTFTKTAAYFDEPFGDSSNIPTGLIAEYASTYVKVALSGDGGDELFYGYGHYRKHWHLPKIQKLRQMLLSDPFTDYKTASIGYFLPHERARLLRASDALEPDPTIHVDLSEAETPLEKINLVDFSMGLPGDMLTKVDRASMMHSLEVRSPFLNPELAQYAYNLPASYKTSKTHGKRILAHAFSDTLPESFFTRKKQGFGAPVAQWLRKPEFHSYITELFSKDPRSAEFLNIDEVQRYINAFYAGDTRLQYKIWVLLSFEMWLSTRTS